MEKRNFDYAVKMHSSRSSYVPDNLMFRQTLRGCERYLYANNKKGPSSRGCVSACGGFAARSERPVQVQLAALDQAAEQGMTLNPWNSQLNADMETPASSRLHGIAEFGSKTRSTTIRRTRFSWKNWGHSRMRALQPGHRMLEEDLQSIE